MAHDPEDEAHGDSLPSPGLTPWPSPSSVTDDEREKRRRSGWLQFLASTSTEPLPVLSPWTRLLQRTSQMLSDLLSVGVSRGGLAVGQRVPALALGLVKGSTSEIGSNPSSSAEPIRLAPVVAGDRLTLTCVLPQPGALVVLMRDSIGVSKLYPTRPEDTRVQQPGSRIQVRGRVSGPPGELQTLLVGLSPQALPLSLLSQEGDELLESLLMLPELSFRTYVLPLEP